MPSSSGPAPVVCSSVSQMVSTAVSAATAVTALSRSGAVTTNRAPELESRWRSSPEWYIGLMSGTTAPQRQAASMVTTAPGTFCSMSATRSPGPIPDALSPAVRAPISASRSAAVHVLPAKIRAGASGSAATRRRHAVVRSGAGAWVRHGIPAGSWGRLDSPDIAHLLGRCPDRAIAR